MSFNRLEKLQFSISQWLYDRFLQLIIYPSIWVAAAIASLGIFAQKILQLTDNWQAIALIFVTALIPYNLDRIFDSYVQKIPDTKAQSFFRKPFIWILLLSAVIATAILLYNAPPSVRYVSTAGIIPLIYGIPLLPLKNQSKWRWYRLKDIPGSKAWIVGSILTYAAIAIPLAYAGAKYDLVAAFLTLFMFVFIVTNSHIFDIRDINSDREKGVITLPIVAGIEGTKLILTAMNIVMLAILIGSWITNTMAYHPEIILATITNLVYIWQVDLDTPRWFYNIWIEACLFVPILTNAIAERLYS